MPPIPVTFFVDECLLILFVTDLKANPRKKVAINARVNNILVFIVFSL
jgi:hypothetical protein